MVQMVHTIGEREFITFKIERDCRIFSLMRSIVAIEFEEANHYGYVSTIESSS